QPQAANVFRPNQGSAQVMILLNYFLIPLSPLLAMIGGGTVLIAAECLPGGGLKTVKYVLSLLFAAASVAFAIALWKSFPSAYSSSSSAPSYCRCRPTSWSECPAAIATAARPR